MKQEMIWSIAVLSGAVIAVVAGWIRSRKMAQKRALDFYTILQGMERVQEGNLDRLIELEEDNEFRRIADAYNDMIRSLKLQMEKNQKMAELVAASQVKQLESQFNPHFLFNSLNAGAQLAVMEDAEQTGVFMEKMADFFRYNVKKMEGDATLLEEIEAVDNYIFILNVRYAGDITYEKQINADIDNIRVPSMILQPIVENAVSHGIHDNMAEGKIQLFVGKEEDQLRISVMDNGIGMSHEEIEAVMCGKLHREQRDGNSTGIGMDNVINRLKLYYNCETPLSIHSEGKGMGTEVTILLPLDEGGMLLV